MPYTFSKDLEVNLYHLDLISKNLTTRLGSILPEVMSELIMSFEENTSIARGMNNTIKPTLGKAVGVDPG